MTTSPLDAPSTDSRALTTPQVGAQVLQNVLGGVGAGVVVATCLWLANVPLEGAWRWPVGVAIITAGIATAWRAWIDEWRAERNWRKREAEHREEVTLFILDLDDVEEQRDDLLDDNAALRSRIQWLEQRLNQPMKINGVPTEPTEDPAHKDALTLINKKYGQGVPVTARHMMSVGWSQARYSAALDVLKSARIVDVRGTQSMWADYPSPDAACSVLYAATPVVLNEITSTSGGVEQ